MSPEKQEADSTYLQAVRAQLIDQLSLIASDKRLPLERRAPFQKSLNKCMATLAVGQERERS